jgi:methyl-accepting chemotaxis protein
MELALSKYKRTIFIVNPKFQFKFALFLCLLVFVTSLFWPATIMSIYDNLAAMQPERMDEIYDMRNSLLFTLGFIEFSVIGIVFVIAIFISHKMAGPMFKLKNYLRNISDGNPASELYFRKGDYFTDVADDINVFVNSILTQRGEDLEYLDEVAAYITNLSLVVPEDKKPVINEIIAKINEMRTRYQE